MVRESVPSELCEDPKVEVGTAYGATTRPSGALPEGGGGSVGKGGPREQSVIPRPQGELQGQVPSLLSSSSLLYLSH